MKLPTNYLTRSFLHALGVMAYIAVVATIMSNGEAIFGNDKTLWGPIAFLMLFVVSATITGLLVLGKPVTLFIEGQKKEAVTFLTATVSWLAVLLSLIFIVRVLISLN